MGLHKCLDSIFRVSKKKLGRNASVNFGLRLRIALLQEDGPHRGEIEHVLDHGHGIRRLKVSIFVFNHAFRWEIVA